MALVTSERTTLTRAATVLAIGVTARFVAAAQGHNYDLDSYQLVGEIVDRGGTVYSETFRYNYGPVWFHILGFLYKLTLGAGLGFVWFRYAVVGFLTLVDIVITAIMSRQFGRRAAALFFLNPVSILITGFHSQFDNLAVLLGLLAVGFLAEGDQRRGTSRRDVAGLALLGASLAVKHILIVFPLWLALRKPDLRSRLIALVMPPVLFALSFAPYWGTASEGISANVFKYRSFDNHPLLEVFVDGGATSTATALAIAALVSAGVYARFRESLHTALLVYLVVLVATAPAIANQYLAIPVPALAASWNPPFAAYSVFTGLYLLKDSDGLARSFVPDAFARAGLRSYQIATLLLSAGLAWHVAARRRARRPMAVAGAVATSEAVPPNAPVRLPKPEPLPEPDLDQEPEPEAVPEVGTLPASPPSPAMQAHTPRPRRARPRSPVAPDPARTEAPAPRPRRTRARPPGSGDG